MTRRPRRAGTLTAFLLATAAALTACGGGGTPDAAPTSSATSTASSTTATPLPTATPVPAPAVGGCYDLSYAQVVSPSGDDTTSPCRRAHTTETYATGTLDNLVDGHLVAVDSARVQNAVAETCPRGLGRFVGGTTAQQRLSMIEPVWFTPSVQQSDAGADWYRCDVTVLADDKELATVRGSLHKVLDTSAGRDRYAMCSRTEPGTAGFSHVLCSADHAWKAIAVVPFAAGTYPGVATVKARGQQPCSDAGRAAASDPLNYKWSYEWPTAEQWAQGQTYGRCWAPSSS